MALKLMPDGGSLRRRGSLVDCERLLVKTLHAPLHPLATHITRVRPVWWVNHSYITINQHC
jgi:hypothetical protein